MHVLLCRDTYFAVTNTTLIMMKANCLPRHACIIYIYIYIIRRGIPSRVLIPHLISIALITIWIIKKYNIVGSLGGKCACGRNQNIDPSNRANVSKKQQSLVLETTDMLLAAAAVPLGYLFLIGWKYE